MSVDAKLLVHCNKEYYIDIVNSVIEYLNTFVRDKLDTYWKEHTDARDRLHFLWGEDYKAQSEMFTNGVSLHGYNLDCLSINFGIGDKLHRSLKVIPCDEENGIMFIVGSWGQYNEIMKVVAQAANCINGKYFEVYYDFNDCDDIGFVQVFDFSDNSSQFRGE